MYLSPTLPLKAALIVGFVLAFLGYHINSQITLPMISVETGNMLTKNSNNGNYDGQTDSQTSQETGQKNDGPACFVSEKYPESIRKWCDLITSFSNQHNLDPDLIAALIWQESGGNSLAYSHSGAVGLMQVMPRDGLAASFLCKNGPCFRNRPSIQELQDPSFNVNYGTSMLAGLYQKYNDFREALKHYGPMDVGYSYADKVLKIYQSYKK